MNKFETIFLSFFLIIFLVFGVYGMIQFSNANTICNITFTDGTILYAENIPYNDLKNYFPSRNKKFNTITNLDFGEFNGNVICKSDYTNRYTTFSFWNSTWEIE